MRVLELTNAWGRTFLDCFRQQGYLGIPGVPVSSGVDSSVFLVGSTISVLKPHLLSPEPVPKRVLLQKAIRTQSLKAMEEGVDRGSVYGSFFLAMGTLAPYAELGETVHLALTYLEGIQAERRPIMIRIHPDDLDLLKACEACGADHRLLLEKDSRPLTYYRHHYGLDAQRINGRNFNLAVSGGGDDWKDVANIIVIERNGQPFAVEFAMGMSTLIAGLHGLPHTMLGNIVADIFPMADCMHYWTGDAISVVSTLESEGVTPNSSRMPGRLLKRYKAVLERLCAQLHLDAGELVSRYGSYERRLALF